MDIILYPIATVVPDSSYSQSLIHDVMRAQLNGDQKSVRLLDRIYRHSGIDTRHSVIRDYDDTTTDEERTDGIFFDSCDRSFLDPSTGSRNDLYAVEARSLFVQTARQAVEASPFDPDDVTHVITVSCTGFFAPGPDYFIVKELALPTDTQRFHIGFMGCYAAFPALRMARSFCRADPDAVVLIVAVELCTLHLQPTPVVDSLIATSVFADGAAGTVVSARAPIPTQGRLRLESFSTILAPDSEKDMAWKIGDCGFEMTLSTYVPRILEANIKEIVDGLLANAGTAWAEIDRWAVHPGGRAILDKVESGLSLAPDALDASRNVLRRYGNMSSPTILFVLNEIMKTPSTGSTELIYAMAFGPGLTVESGLLTRL